MAVNGLYLFNFENNKAELSGTLWKSLAFGSRHRNVFFPVNFKPSVPQNNFSRSAQPQLL